MHTQDSSAPAKLLWDRNTDYNSMYTQIETTFVLTGGNSM